MFRNRFTPFGFAFVVFQLFYFKAVSFEWAVMLMFIIAMLGTMFFTPISFYQYNIYQPVDLEEETEDQDT